MKRLIMFLFCMCLSSIAYAETIHLKNGNNVSGKILVQDEKSVKINSNGLEMIYYADEIIDIDGKPMMPQPKVSKTQELSEDPKVKRELILKFIDVFGTRKAMTHSIEVLLNNLSQQRPQEVEKLRERFKIDEMIERLIPLYDKHFSSEDLKTYIAFYSTAQGQKLISSIGIIMNESVRVGAEYLKEKFPEIADRQ